MDLQREDGCTPLFIAAAKGDAAVTELLIAARCNVDLQDKDGCTPLHLAAHNGHATVTKQLIEAGCNITDIVMRNTEQKIVMRNTKQKVAGDILRWSLPPEYFLDTLAAVPAEDWCRTWAACRTIMLRRTSKMVQEQVDKMRLPAVVHLCELWRKGIEINSLPRFPPKSSRLQKLQIVMNELPLMTARCRMTTL